MEIKEIKRIIELMSENDLAEFELEEANFRISIKRRNGFDSQVMAPPGSAPAMMVAPNAPAASQPHAGVAPPPEAAPAGADLTEVQSPMGGTFYRSSSPDGDAFVTVGQEVEEETVVCIIEAMKVMNEIKAEVKGIVRRILVENGTAVEYGQPLFEIDPL
jgi:acetyl-CoA carboxylase biotin carboxyl carrier protein